MIVRVQKWGNSLGVRIPKNLARESAIREGTEFEVTCDQGRIVLRPPKTPSLKQLVAKIKPANRPEMADWGRSVGGEVW